MGDSQWEIWETPGDQGSDNLENEREYAVSDRITIKGEDACVTQIFKEIFDERKHSSKGELST